LGCKQGKEEAMSWKIFGHNKNADGIILTTNENYTPPPSYTEQEAKRIAKEWRKREGVADARPVTFAGMTHVHIDYYAADGTDNLGDIGIVAPGKEERIEVERYDGQFDNDESEEEPEARPWWKFW
jgi:hypothetical protein